MIFVSHLLEDNEIKELVAKTGMGVESIEFSVSENLNSLKSRIKEYRQRMEEMEVSALTLHGPFLDLNATSYDSMVLKATRLRYEQAYEAASELSAEKLVFHTGFLPRVYYVEGWAERMADFYNSFMEGKRGIKICLENVYDPDPAPIADVKRRVESEDFGLCLDIGHAHCYSDIALSDWINCFLPYIYHIHAHDNNRVWDYHMGLGKGTIELNEVLTKLKAALPGATVTIECTSKEDVEKSFKVLSEYGF